MCMQAGNLKSGKKQFEIGAVSATNSPIHMMSMGDCLRNLFFEAFGSNSEAFYLHSLSINTYGFKKIFVQIIFII